MELTANATGIVQPDNDVRESEADKRSTLENCNSDLGSSANSVDDDSLIGLRKYYTEEEFFYDHVSTRKRLVILLSKEKEISSEVQKELDNVVTLSTLKNVHMSHLYYVNTSCPVVIKLDSMIAYQGIRENYSDSTSKIISFDSRLVCRKGEKHIGILSLIRALASIGDRLHIASLRGKSRSVTDVINSDDKQRNYPGARARVMPCPESHITCADVWEINDEKAQSIREMLQSTRRDGGQSGQSRNEDVQRKRLHPLCLFALKIVKPLRVLPRKGLTIPEGIFVTPPQFDPQSKAHIEAQALGLKPFSYGVCQLKNLGDGDQKLLQCAVKPHYKTLWRRSSKSFKAVELVFGSYLLSAFYLESNEKMSLHLDIMDELVTPIEGRSAELENHEGSFNFTQKDYCNHSVEYSDDENDETSQLPLSLFCNEKYSERGVKRELESSNKYGQPFKKSVT